MIFLSFIYTSLGESISFFPCFFFSSCFYANISINIYFVNIYINIYLDLFVAMFPQSTKKQEGCTLEAGPDLLVYFRRNYLFLKRIHFLALHYHAS